mmetsp:Transcript_3878/g.8742  ORF Transcript_3878/g.8742 Transcript_3878/m.8742 type:complete len:98 (-) Transcript_3878:124-417(-)
MMYLSCTLLANHQVLFSVSGKSVRSAVARNKLKRRMREAYRLNKYRLASSSPRKYFLIGYIYMGTGNLCDFVTIQDRIIFSLRYLNQLYIRKRHGTL